jgi:mono/diheme cytochrome c family protein
MSRLVVLLLILFVVLPLVVPHFCADAQAGPHLVLCPQVSFPETEFDLGEIDEGIEISHKFKIENHGKKTLLIKTAYSTCGCTVPHIKKKEIPPGESGDLDVVMNTAMKQGDIVKPIEIRTNDPVNPVSTIYIKARVRSCHGELGTDRIATIFSGRCAACHVKNGVDKFGEDLFFADCYMCHGFRAKGIPSVGPALIPFDYHNKDLAAAMKKIIAIGSKSHRSMPGYATDAGGPLSDKQIDSLVDYLQTKSDMELKEKK